jgi:hypothetical protein
MDDLIIDLDNDKKQPNIYITPIREKPPESPSHEKKRIQNEQLREEWSGCCSRTNKHYLKYMTQISMGSCVILFSMIQIILDAPHKEIYFSMISGTLGSFMPHPQIKEN